MFPKVLKQMNLYNDSLEYLGIVTDVVLPKLSHVMQDFRSGGMLGSVKIDMGLEVLEMEYTVEGLETQIIRQLGAPQIDAVLLRFMGSYQDDRTGKVSHCEVVMRGRIQELDRGSAKPGEKTEHKVKAVLSYYKEILDGRELLEIDPTGLVYRVDGVDRYAEIRAGVGL